MQTLPAKPLRFALIFVPCSARLRVADALVPILGAIVVRLLPDAIGEVEILPAAAMSIW